MKSALIAALLTAALTASASAQGLLDQQLGPTPAPAAKPDTAKSDTPKADDQKPATPPSTPAPANPITMNANDIISPDAVKKVDDADLIDKLTKTEETKKANEAAEKMKDMLDRMGQSETRLTQKDPGDVTQETQRRILTDLDVLIEYARLQQQSGSGQSQQQQQGQGQGRSYSQGNQNGKNQGGSTAAGSSFLPGGQDPARPGEDIRSRGPEEWGKLRPRERDLISHGANEEYLSSYKDMIERYYQALAELGKKK